ncbi:MAG TPA: sulfatase [Bryobacteraceae bacterium]|jgi:arylsulfatase A-like enzyme|nr:sulfatase [Bryobacteraceae bacterium]
MSVSRRSFLEMAALSVLPPAPAAKHPNIILLLGDDHRWDALGCMGNAVVQTPNLDRLAREGILFENHFATTPICCASRASIMLGEYAGGHGIYDFATPFSPAQVATTYWGQMRRAGYHIGFIGKFGVGNKMPEDAFDVWMGFPGQGFYFPDGPNGPHLNHIMRDQAIEFLESAPANKPFCLSISFKSPHVQDEDPRQYLPSQDTEARYKNIHIPPHPGAKPEDINRFPPALQHSENRRRWGVRFSTPEIYQASMNGYYRLVTGIDDVVAALRESLSKLGIADNTIIIYSADHGIFNGEHGFAGKWYGHEESLRIPLIIYDPRLPSPAASNRINAMTLNIDLQPTVLELAGLSAGFAVHGRSVSPFLQNPQSPERSIWYFEHRFPFRGWIPSSEGIRTKRWKYIRYTDVAAPYEELYHLESDPIETVNLAGNSSYLSQQKTLTRYCQTWERALASWKPGAEWRDPISQSDLERDGLI